MSTPIGQPVASLDSPQLLIDLDVVDANLGRVQDALRGTPVGLRVHFKSLKCGGVAKYLQSKGAANFLCAKLNEAEVLAGAGIKDILVANQIVGPIKLKRVADLAKRVNLHVCVDDADNVAQLSNAAQAAGVRVGVLVEVNVGMNRCGVEPGEPAVALAKLIQQSPVLRFDGLQGYDGHAVMIPDPAERKAKSDQASQKLVSTRRLIEQAGIPVPIVTGAGTGTWEFVARYDGFTEIQPGSFILMDCIYNAIRPEFKCALSIVATAISKKPGQYVLDAGSKAISRDFGTPIIKNHRGDKIVSLAEEHARVESNDSSIKVGDRREVIPAHCCATMNLHRNCVAVRQGKVEALWPIEASGRYD